MCGARTMVIAGQGDGQVAPFAGTLIEVPVTATLLQPLVATVPLQVFACELAAAKGMTWTSRGTWPNRSRSSDRADLAAGRTLRTESPAQQAIPRPAPALRADAQPLWVDLLTLMTDVSG